MKVNTYMLATSLEEAYLTLQETTENAILGGGAWMKLSTKKVNTLISLDNLGLNGIKEIDGWISIKSMTTLREIETSPLIQSIGKGVLSSCINQIMGVTIRNIATIGGSIVSKFGFSDLIPVLLVLNTRLVFHKHGEISLKSFLESKIVGRDILTEVLIKKCNSPVFFKKVKTTALDFAILNICVSKTEEGFKIALGSRPGLAELAVQSMNYLNQLNTVSENEINQAASMVVKEIHFSSNQRAQKEYREQLAEVYVRRGLKEVLSI
ncbi:MAG: FAD binding domain-containing protein [Firmicutes bacterium]|nr:FAD binding domain-containing protein [Bacillota bacterium]